MSRKYSELVVEGPFQLVKGFVAGFLSGSKPDSRFFFHRKNGIQRETMKDIVKEVFDMESHVHLCLEQETIEPFKDAVKCTHAQTDMKIESVKPVKSAHFDFSFKVYNEQLADQIGKVIKNTPQNTELKDYTPHEYHSRDEVELAEYSAVHAYHLQASGTITGDFEGVMDTFLHLRKSDFSESIMLGEVVLEFGTGGK